jgi:3-phosphoshikimate 1-carboxyvinyltransferase
MQLVRYLHNPIQCTINLPLSKSIINRLLVINHLSGGEYIKGLENEAADILTMQDLLHEISKKGGPGALSAELNVGNAGTVMRFLTAVAAITSGKWKITGSERMQQRPVKPLADALFQLGADINFEQIAGYPPLLINGNEELRGGKVEIDAGISSQFISALMMIAPKLKGGLTIHMNGAIISSSYIRMTKALMQKAGADISFNGNEIVIKEGAYNHFDFITVTEPDWSAAAFWYQVAAFAPKADILLKAVTGNSVQGDSVLPEIFKNLGVASDFTEEGLHISKSSTECAVEFDYDFTECPDLAQPVIVSCAALGIEGRFTGLKTLRVKETDRIAALKNELLKLGYAVDVVDDQILLHGKNPSVPKAESPVIIHCYDDHRMAMSFATLALLRNDICLDEPAVVVKSYPAFWKDMAMAGIVIMG